MKKLLLTLILTIIMSLGFAAIANAESGSFWFSGGSKDGHGSFAVGFGGETLGFEFGVIDNADAPYDTLDYPCPHWNFTSLGTRTLEASAGIDLIGMIQLSENIILYGGPGLYWHRTGEVVRSNDTGWYYTETDNTTTEIAGSGGIRFFLTRGTRLGIGYHSLRGTNVTFQLSF